MAEPSEQLRRSQEAAAQAVDAQIPLNLQPGAVLVPPDRIDRALAPTVSVTSAVPSGGPGSAQPQPSDMAQPQPAVDPVERATRPTPQRGTIGRAAIAAPPPADPTAPAEQRGIPSAAIDSQQFPLTEEIIGPSEEGVIGGHFDQAKREVLATEQASEVMLRAEERLRTVQAKQQERLQQVADEQALRLHQLDQQITQLRNTRFDADRLFSNASGATQFGAALGIAVGHMLQVRNNIMFPGSNTPNAALNIINDAIERDIRTQTQQFQNGVTVLGQERTAMGLARQVGLDQVAVEAFAKEKILEQVERHLTQIAVRHQGTQAGFRLQQAAHQFALQRGVYDQTMRQSAQAALMAQANTGRARAQVVNDFVGFADIVPGRETEYTAWMDGRGNGAGAKRVEIVQAARMFDGMVRELIDLVNTSSTSDLIGVGSTSNLVTSSIHQLLTTFKNTEELGAMDAGVVEIWEKILANPASAAVTRQTFNRQAQLLLRNTQRKVRAIVEPAVAAGILTHHVPSDQEFALPAAPGQEELDTRARARISEANQNTTNVILEGMLGPFPGRFVGEVLDSGVEGAAERAARAVTDGQRDE